MKDGIRVQVSASEMRGESGQIFDLIQGGDGPKDLSCDAINIVFVVSRIP